MRTDLPIRWIGLRLGSPHVRGRDPPTSSHELRWFLLPDPGAGVSDHQPIVADAATDRPGMDSSIWSGLLALKADQLDQTVASRQGLGVESTDGPVPLFVSTSGCCSVMFLLPRANSAWRTVTTTNRVDRVCNFISSPRSRHITEPDTLEPSHTRSLSSDGNKNKGVRICEFPLHSYSHCSRQ